MDGLGLTVHPTKSCLIPTQVLQYLGFILNSILMTVTLTDKKRGKIIALCHRILTKPQCTIRELAMVIGNLVAAEPGVEIAPIFYRRLESEKTRKVTEAKGDFDSTMTLSDTARQDLLWWRDNVHSQVRHIYKPEPQVVITTDSSDFAWGGTKGTQTAGGPWGDHEIEWHINLKELTAILFTLQTLCRTDKETHIRILTDNTTCVSYINKKGGKMTRLNETAREIWLWAIERNIWLSAVHLPGCQNVTADALSRADYDTNTEWQLNADIFRAIQELAGPLEIDLFASRLNHQCQKYVAWRPDPNAIYIDAFHIKWDSTNLYAFPPFSIIGRVLQKIEQDGGDLAAVLPLWPTQPWFSKALLLSYKAPYILPKYPQSLRLPQDPQQVHPLINRLKLTLFFISGNVYKTKAFQLGLPKLSSAAGENPQKPNIGCISGSGCNFRLRDRLIHCKHLLRST